VQQRVAALQAKFPVIKEVRGLGLIWGLELAQEGTAVVNACRERGLLLNCTQGNVIRLLPPLVVSKEEIDRGLQILEAALALL
jgi:acetylornithine/succinyldiaminopimelate/putrescine aminotransferase